MAGLPSLTLTRASSRRCRICGKRPAIDGDGPGTPCRVCLYRNGHAAARADLLNPGEIALLELAHGDVVLSAGISVRAVWIWCSAWPGRGDYTLARPRDYHLIP